MGKLFDLLKASAGERNTRNALGRWRQAVSEVVEQAAARTSGSVHYFDENGTALTEAFTLGTWEPLTPLLLVPASLTPDLRVNPLEGDLYLQYIGTEPKILTLRGGVSLSVAGIAVRESFGLAFARNGVLDLRSRSYGITTLVQDNLNALHLTTQISQLVQPDDIIDLRLAELVTGDLVPTCYSAYLVVAE